MRFARPSQYEAQLVRVAAAACGNGSIDNVLDLKSKDKASIVCEQGRREKNRRGHPVLTTIANWPYNSLILIMITIHFNVSEDKSVFFLFIRCIIQYSSQCTLLAHYTSHTIMQCTKYIMCNKL